MDRRNRTTSPRSFDSQRDSNGHRREESLFGSMAPSQNVLPSDISMSLEDRRRRAQLLLSSHTDIPTVVGGEQFRDTNKRLLSQRVAMAQQENTIEQEAELARLLRGRESQFQRHGGMIQQRDTLPLPCFESLASSSTSSILSQQQRTQAQQQLRSEDDFIMMAERRIQNLRRMIQEEERNLERRRESRSQQRQMLDVISQHVDRESDLTSRIMEETLRQREPSLRYQEQEASLICSGASSHLLQLQAMTDDRMLLSAADRFSSLGRLSREQVQDHFVPRDGNPARHDRQPHTTANRMANVPSSSSPTWSAVGDKATTIAPREDTKSCPTPPPKTTQPVRKLKPGEGLALALPADEGSVSSYQGLIRESLEFFQSQASDMLWNIQGRKNKVVPDQIGVRCRYCACRPLHWRGRGAVYFPGKLSCVYQAAQNMTLTHLLDSCKEIPAKVKDNLQKERSDQRIRDKRGGGKKYWVEACLSMGIGEREDVPGLWFC